MSETGFRKKVTGITFIFSMLVVFIHGNNIQLFLDPENSGGLGTAVSYLEIFMAEVLGPIAVPGFFMLSAYLFYRNFSWSQLERKWISRVKSVLIPYIAWNALYYLGYVIFRRIPALEGIVGEGAVPLGLNFLVDAIVNFTYNPVFWYLYQLILLIALAPVIYCIVFNKYLGVVALAAIGTALHYRIDFPHLNMDALFYYLFAAFAGVHCKRWVEEAGPGKLAGITLLIFGGLCYLISYKYNLVLFTVLYRLLTPVAIWFLADGLADREVKPWMSNGFFLYAFHFIIVRALNKGFAMVLMHTPLTALLVYLAVPAATVYIAWKTGAFLSKKIPPLWYLLSGGR